MKREMKEHDLAIKLFFDLPFWKRWNSKKAILSNGWDYTGEWGKCQRIASALRAELNKPKI